MKTLSPVFLAVLLLSKCLPVAIFGFEPSTVTPVPSNLKKFMPKLFQEKLRELENGTIEFVMIGDSITHSWSKYPGTFKESNLLNLGFPGDRTQNVLWRIENGALDGISPKLVTLMIGTNNMHDTKKAYPADKPDEIFAGIQAIVTEVRTRLPNTKIVVFSVFPRKEGSENDRVKAVNEMLPQLADGKYVSHIDLNRFFTKEEKKEAKKIISHANKYWQDHHHTKHKGIIFLEASSTKLNDKQFGIKQKNKDWGYNNWKELINKIKEDFLIIQSIHKESKKIPGVFSPDNIDFRLACAILNESDLYVGPEGGFGHVAAALNKKAVLYFGGWISPDVIGYDFHENLYYKNKLSPCGEYNRLCKHCEEARKAISVNVFLKHIYKVTSD